MSVRLQPRLSRNKQRIYYTVSWGTSRGQRISTGIFTYTHPSGKIQRQHNKEALQILETKRSNLILDQQTVGTGILLPHRIRTNFLDFYQEYVVNNTLPGNRHLQGSFQHFRTFLSSTHLSPLDLTEDLCARFRKFLLDHFNGDLNNGAEWGEIPNTLLNLNKLNRL
jgi:hypothetical protein